MEPQRIPLALTPEEYRLITALRDLPEGPLRERAHQVLERLQAFARQPRCAQSQADGVPCAEPAADCDQCPAAEAALEAQVRIPPRDL
jgi:hypothetical protein